MTNIEILKLKEQELHTKEQEVRDALEQLKQEVIPLAKKELNRDIYDIILLDWDQCGKEDEVKKLVDTAIEKIDWDAHWEEALYHIEEEEELTDLKLKDYVWITEGWRWNKEEKSLDWPSSPAWVTITDDIAAELKLDNA